MADMMMADMMMADMMMADMMMADMMMKTMAGTPWLVRDAAQGAGTPGTPVAAARQGATALHRGRP